MKGHSLYSSNRSNWARVPAGDSQWGKLPTAGSGLMAGLLARVVPPGTEKRKEPKTPKGAERNR